MTNYTASADGGWMIVVKATNVQDARRQARDRAGSASLLPSDVGLVRRSTDAEVAWYESMGGELR